jgi:hypothetical protein
MTGQEKILKNLESLQDVKIRWGVHGSELSKIAYWNEFGTKNIPERPAHRNCFRDDNTKRLISKAAAGAVDQVLAGKDFKDAAAVIGEVGLGALKRSYVNGPFAANAESTIEKKGAGKNPLYDTGTLQDNLAYEVVNA